MSPFDDPSNQESSHERSNERDGRSDRCGGGEGWHPAGVAGGGLVSEL